jgi:GalNAc-alpha-(1->4)-GalNAc-alpha-(1->3)-diNAcBac-PP-undecaprenol alpha-1,4-N-acetyl-D-galactosaminyltransferase
MLSGSSRNARITLVIAGLNGGGAERVCVNLANAWVAQGRPVTIQTVFRKSRAPAYTIDSRVELRDVGWPRVATLAELNMPAIAAIMRGVQVPHCSVLIAEITLLALIRHAILATNPDLVVSFIDMTNVRVLAAVHETGLPVIACEQTDTRHVSLGRCQQARRVLYRRAAAVVAPHSSTAQYLAESGARSYAIPNPLVAPPVINIERTKGRRRLVSLMRLSEEKRPHLLVRAFANIAADFPEWDLEIYGEGPMHPFLARIARHAPDQIHLRGFVRDNYAVLRGANLFVSTSWVEGFGNAIWEALACGVPVVAMECGDPVRALVRDGIDGMIVRGGIPELAAALASLMRDEPRRKALAGHAPEVLTRFAYETSVEAWDRLISRVLDEAA